MKRFIPIIIVLLVSVSFSDLQAQQRKKPIQISGIVITADSVGQFIPYANITVKNRRQGAITSAEGFFSFPALPSDTIVFSALGFKKEKLIIPDSLSQNEYLAKVVMRRDTTLLQEVTLYPWPTPERFKDAFLATRVPTTQEDIAMRNLAIQELKARAAEMGYSPEELQDFSIMQREGEIYNYGRYQGFSNGGAAILGSLTNPFAWAEFFSALKRGDFSSNR
ncbi:MAG: carboxypeptidase-like regulatory domain-containing protein [Owenweeksia sp.]